MALFPMFPPPCTPLNKGELTRGKVFDRYRQKMYLQLSFFSQQLCGNKVVMLRSQMSQKLTLSNQKKSGTTSFYWLVVSTQWKNISQMGSFPPNRGEHKKYLKPPPSLLFPENPSCSKSIPVFQTLPEIVAGLFFLRKVVIFRKPKSIIPATYIYIYIHTP